MNSAIESMLDKYRCVSRLDYENALKEIIQEIALLGLWRSKFFEHAAFYGGTALRILYGMDRFSEDIDFSLLSPDPDFELSSYLRAIEVELNSMDLNVEVVQSKGAVDTAIESAFIKAGTKEHLIRIAVPDEISDRIGRKDLLKIKIEVDTEPPSGFETEAKTLLQPIAFSVRSYRLPDLFAGKIHAVLQGSWKSGRVKGRDFYDFVWYVGRATPVRLAHLEQRLRQTGGWTEERSMTRDDLLKLLEARFGGLDVESARRDVRPFIRDQGSLEIWSNDFFLSLLANLSVL
ncbi:MAG: nucleotidyl transferase AbiEii/AbiGii toxin family protein [Cyanobacteria bacterium HKST-UBA02]|nr:nucleotidyl transferase AbiEii/AbiGii toxin family protein [Cyanobacteria bacterium HKST-UBA02]